MNKAMSEAMGLTEMKLETLLKAYESAQRVALNDEFIQILRNEINSRNIIVDSTERQIGSR
jgi:hypothetical protein